MNPKRLHRRRSSLPNLKLLPLTIAERRALARRKKKEEQERLEAEKKRLAAEKKLRAKQLRQATKTKDAAARSKHNLRSNGQIKCDYCFNLIDGIEFDDHYVSHPTHIRHRIWLGNAENSKDINFIKKYGITHILNCTKEIDLDKKISKKIKSFKRISIQDRNSETILDYIRESNNFIELSLATSTFNVIFIHCREGRSRSVSFLCAYLMWKENCSFYAALSDVRSKRFIVLPNSKFYHELELFDKDLILDRQSAMTPRSKRYGTPINTFKLQKINQKIIIMHGNTPVAINDIQLINGGNFNFPNTYNHPNISMNNSNDNNINVNASPLSIISPLSNISPLTIVTPIGTIANQNGLPPQHSRKRSSSLSRIDYRQLSFRSNSNRGSVLLSPIQGSPAGKKIRAFYDDQKSPYDGIFDDSDTDDNVNVNKKKKKKKKSNKSNGSSSNNGSVKKKSGKKKKKSHKNDLNVEQAMDISDIFPNGNKSKKKKKSSTNSKKKDKKKKKSSSKKKHKKMDDY